MFVILTECDSDKQIYVNADHIIKMEQTRSSTLLTLTKGVLVVKETMNEIRCEDMEQRRLVN